ncbi:hypothetical protein [uncultured Deefgea sp.]|uniref:hypothetical protein n=1 Tax=uncultured Deefgea sp. TaxID=1304914 RepID=UPI002595044E|nr:hypothetical protein [uncultured Deefgea sp.]
MQLKPLIPLLALTILSACSSGEDSAPSTTESTPTPVVANPVAGEMDNRKHSAHPSSAHQDNGLPPVIEQF